MRKRIVPFFLPPLSRTRREGCGKRGKYVTYISFHMHEREGERERERERERDGVLSLIFLFYQIEKSVRPIVGKVPSHNGNFILVAQEIWQDETARSLKTCGHMSK